MKYTKMINLKRIACIVLCSISMILVISTSVKAFTAFSSGLELKYSTAVHYSDEFNTKKSGSVAPYIKYNEVLTQGNYYVGSAYKSSAYTWVNLESTKYYASNIADGRVVSVILTKDVKNKVYIKGTSALHMTISSMEVPN